MWCCNICVWNILPTIITYFTYCKKNLLIIINVIILVLDICASYWNSNFHVDSKHDFNFQCTIKDKLFPTFTRLLRTSKHVFVTVTSNGTLERTWIDILGGSISMFSKSESSSSTSGDSSPFVIIWQLKQIRLSTFQLLTCYELFMSKTNTENINQGHVYI